MKVEGDFGVRGREAVGACIAYSNRGLKIIKNQNILYTQQKCHSGPHSLLQLTNANRNKRIHV